MSVTIPPLDCVPSEAWILNGSRLLVESDATPNTFLDVIEITTFGFPGGAGSDTEVTRVNTCDRNREYISGLVDPSDVSFTANWIPSAPSHDHLTGLRFMQGDGKLRNWKIVCSDTAGTKIAFRGYVRDFTPSGGGGGDVAALDFTIRMSGTETYSYTTPPAVMSTDLWGTQAAIDRLAAEQGLTPAASGGTAAMLNAAYLANHNEPLRQQAA